MAKRRPERPPRVRPRAPMEGGALAAREVALLAGAFAALALVVYAPALGGPFLSDDLHYVATNPYVHELSLENLVAILDPTSPATVFVVNYAPVHLLLHALTWQVVGEHTPAYHVVNVLLHAIGVGAARGRLRARGALAAGRDRRGAGVPGAPRQRRGGRVDLAGEDAGGVRALDGGAARASAAPGARACCSSGSRCWPSRRRRSRCPSRRCSTGRASAASPSPGSARGPRCSRATPWRSSRRISAPARPSRSPTTRSCGCAPASRSARATSGWRRRRSASRPSTSRRRSARGSIRSGSRAPARSPRSPSAAVVALRRRSRGDRVLGVGGRVVLPDLAALPVPVSDGGPLSLLHPARPASAASSSQCAIAIARLAERAHRTGCRAPRRSRCAALVLAFAAHSFAARRDLGVACARARRLGGALSGRAQRRAWSRRVAPRSPETPDAAFAALRRAWELGFNRFEQLQSDPCLASLRAIRASTRWWARSPAGGCSASRPSRTRRRWSCARSRWRISRAASAPRRSRRSSARSQRGTARRAAPRRSGAGPSDAALSGLGCFARLAAAPRDRAVERRRDPSARRHARPDRARRRARIAPGRTRSTRPLRARPGVPPPASSVQVASAPVISPAFAASCARMRSSPRSVKRVLCASSSCMPSRARLASPDSRRQRARMRVASSASGERTSIAASGASRAARSCQRRSDAASAPARARARSLRARPHAKPTRSPDRRPRARSRGRATRSDRAPAPRRRSGGRSRPVALQRERRACRRARDRIALCVGDPRRAFAEAAGRHAAHEIRRVEARQARARAARAWRTAAFAPATPSGAASTRGECVASRLRSSVEMRAPCASDLAARLVERERGREVLGHGDAGTPEVAGRLRERAFARRPRRRAAPPTTGRGRPSGSAGRRARAGRRPAAWPAGCAAGPRRRRRGRSTARRRPCRSRRLAASAKNSRV